MWARPQYDPTILAGTVTLRGYAACSSASLISCLNDVAHYRMCKSTPLNIEEISIRPQIFDLTRAHFRQKLTDFVVEESKSWIPNKTKNENTFFQTTPFNKNHFLESTSLYRHKNDEKNEFGQFASIEAD